MAPHLSKIKSSPPPSTIGESEDSDEMNNINDVINNHNDTDDEQLIDEIIHQIINEIINNTIDNIDVVRDTRVSINAEKQLKENPIDAAQQYVQHQVSPNDRDQFY